MGQRGPQPLPSALKRARGTYRQDRAALNEPVPTGSPKLASFVTDPDARKEYRRLLKLLTDLGVVGAIDSNLLTRYALTWIRWRRVVQTLTGNPAAEFMAIKDNSGNVKMLQVSAMHSIARSLADELGRMEASLGMSPAARSRINVSNPQPQPDDKSQFFSAGPFKLSTGDGA